ncbi:MAG: hypothetical protein IT317_10985 [Anaerolineales bacterium]|nr:hypothetical protein [Anaerolineales bacterium]
MPLGETGLVPRVGSGRFVLLRGKVLGKSSAWPFFYNPPHLLLLAEAYALAVSQRAG